MRRRSLALAAFLLPLLLLPLAASSEVTDEDLQRAREQKERLQQEMNAAAAAYTQAVRAGESTREKIGITTVEVVSTQARYDALRQIVARRAVAAYKGERSGQLDAVLSARNWNDLVDRAAYLERATASDGEVIEGLRVAGADLRQRREELARLEAQQREAVRRAEMLQSDLEGKLSEAREYEDTLIGQRLAEDEARRRAAEEEARRKAALEEARRLAEAVARGEPLPALLRPSILTVIGDFVCPVAGPVAYSDDYGAPRSGHAHEGNDLFAGRGTPVVAVRSGTVSVQEGGLGGLMIFLYAGADTFFYAHLDSFLVSDGASVAQGETIGTVGSTGNAMGEVPHLHFEIQLGGETINPYPTVSAAC